VVHADITSEESIKNAFTQGWDKSVRNLPVTGFHTASVINASYQTEIFMDKLTPVNIVGTANVISASKTIGADILIYTSSGSVPVRPLQHWLPPWKKHHDLLVQPLLEPGDANDVRLPSQYFALYAATKARAEQMTLKANSSTLRPGSIRPCNGIYWNKYDLCLGAYLIRNEMVT
jgi:nucleoside-diphosphate-sugar epimerase